MATIVEFVEYDDGKLQFSTRRRFSTRAAAAEAAALYEQQGYPVEIIEEVRCAVCGAISDMAPRPH